MKHQTKKRERGVAILFSLGILGMMTVLALTFASISMTNQTIAKNASGQTSAKEMARGIVERVKSALSYSGYVDKTAGGTNPPVIGSPAQLRRLYSKASGSSDFDWIWKLGMTGTDIESALYRTDEVCDYSSPGTQPTWQYVRTGSNPTDPIIGRFAYVVKAADLPVLDFNTAFLKEDGSASSDTYTRLGMSLNEINPDLVYEAILTQLSIAAPAYSNFSAISGLIARAKTGLASSGRLGSYADFETYLPSMTNENKKQVSKIIANAYSPRSTRYPEIFLTETGSAAYRFDLSKISTISGEGNKRKLVERMVGGSEGAPSGWDVSHYNPIVIPWLKDFTDSEGGYDSAQQKAKQIAANIVDFFTTDNKPTSDKDNNSWFTDPPNYIGLKKTPLIYGYGGQLKLTVQQESTKIDEEQYTHKLTVTPSFTPTANICNFFSFSGGILNISSVQIGIKGSIKLTYKINDTDTNTAELSLDTSSGETPKQSIWDYFFDSKRKDVGCYTLDFNEKNGSGMVNNYTSPTANQYESYAVKVIKVELSDLKIGLNYNGTWVDFAVINQDTDGSTFEKESDFEVTADSSSAKDITLGLAFRVSDPRHNRFSSLWRGKVSATTNFETLANTISFTMPTECDLASNPLPGNPKDAYPYHPQAAISTPWEIGQIHRGNSWQTINLKKYKATNPTKGGTYSDGDANLLDQVRLSNATDSYGKIPLNEIWGSYADTLFNVLQIKARTTDNRNVSAGGSSSETMKQKTNKPSTDSGGNLSRAVTVTSFFNDQKAKSEPFFKYRGELANLLTYSDSNNTKYNLFDDSDEKKPTTDAALEELFTKCAMLFDAEPTFLPRRVYVFGIAQTILDINGSAAKIWNNDGSLTNNAGTTSTGKYNAGYMTSSGLEVSVSGSFSYPNSGVLSSTYGTYVNGVDKILSEQKVFAILEREYTSRPYYYTSSTDYHLPKWKIVRFEYVQ